MPDTEKALPLSVVSTIRDWVKGLIPTKTSDLTNDSGFISTETDPTVPSWAKTSTKPTYTAQEVGALPSSTSIPSATSDLTNDSGFITSSDLVQSDWEEDDNTDPAHVLNRPAIRTGDGQNSIIEGNLEVDSNAAEYTLYFSGSGSTLSYTTNDTLPSVNNILYNSTLYDIGDAVYIGIINIDTSNNTIVINKSYNGTITNREVKLLYRYHIADKRCSHAEGDLTVAGSEYAHAEGNGTKAIGTYAHAEGWQTKALEVGTHAEGYRTIASAIYTHAEGANTQALGKYSHTEGRQTIASGEGQHVQGKFNIQDTQGTYADIVGNGTGDNARSNAYTLDWNGNGWYAGKVTVGADPTNNMDLATKQYVDNATSGITTNLAGLTDTTISNPTNGQILKYDGSSSKWVNGDNSALYVVTISRLGSVGSYWYSSDKTYSEIYAAYSSGKVCIAICDWDTVDQYCLSLVSCDYIESSFTSFFKSASYYGILTINVNSSGVVFEQKYEQFLPISISSPTNGQLLKYNATSGKWENATPTTYSLSLSNNVITLTGSDGSTSSITLPVYNGTVTTGGGS